MQLLTVVIVNVILICMTFDGLRRGWEYGPINEREHKTMIVESIQNPSGRSLLPTFQASGRLLTDGRRIEIPIFEHEYKSLRKGDRLVVFELPRHQGAFITQSKMEESKPFVRLGPLAVTWHFFVGALGISFFLYYEVFTLRKQKTRGGAAPYTKAMRQRPPGRER